VKHKHLDRDRFDVLIGALKAKPCAEHLLLELLARTGIRAEELACLKWRNLSGDVLNLTEAAKGSLGRTLGLDEDFVKRLRHAQAFHSLKPEEPIMLLLGPEYFDASRPRIRHNFKQRLRHAWRDIRGEVLGPEAAHLGMHSLRHTVAILMLHSTEGNIMKVRRALGHRSIQSTVSYIDYLDSQSVQLDILKAVKG
jgi:integrase